MNGNRQQREDGMAAIAEAFGCPFHRRISLTRYTSFSVGGEAPVMFFPGDPETAREVYQGCGEEKIPLKILGGGTNLLVREGPLDFGVLNTRGLRGNIEVDGTTLRAPCGAAMTTVAREAMRFGLTGLEFFSTLPGTVGGAVAVNAGWPEERIQDSVTSVLSAGSDSEGGVLSAFILRVTLSLSRGDAVEIQKKSRAFLEMRQKKQPLGAKSAGCIFHNPAVAPAGQLIEEAGLKGFAMGGAEVSQAHANFIVNRGDATAADIFNLIEAVKHRVFERSGVALEEEIVIW